MSSELVLLVATKGSKDFSGPNCPTNTLLQPTSQILYNGSKERGGYLCTIR